MRIRIVFLIVVLFGLCGQDYNIPFVPRAPASSEPDVLWSATMTGNNSDCTNEPESGTKFTVSTPGSSTIVCNNTSPAVGSYAAKLVGSGGVPELRVSSAWTSKAITYYRFCFYSDQTTGSSINLLRGRAGGSANGDWKSDFLPESKEYRIFCDFGSKSQTTTNDKHETGTWNELLIEWDGDADTVTLKKNESGSWAQIAQLTACTTPPDDNGLFTSALDGMTSYIDEIYVFDGTSAGTVGETGC